ncbi:hypothetical protein [Methylobacterium sp. JK268]
MIDKVLALKVLKFLNRPFSDFYSAYKHGSPTIIICGRGGAGKSELIKAIKERKIQDPSLYIQSIGRENGSVGKRFFFNVIALPGQMALQKSEILDDLQSIVNPIYRRNALKAELSETSQDAWLSKLANILKIEAQDLFSRDGSGRLLVVHCVCFGYSAQTEREEAQYAEKEFSEYCEYSKKQEIEYIKFVLEQIPYDMKFKLITLVNKKDLWFERKHDAALYYTEGLYATEVNNFIRGRFGVEGGRVPAQEILYCSVARGPLKTASGKIIAQPTGWYEEHTAKIEFERVLNQLIHAVESMSKRRDA